MPEGPAPIPVKPLPLEYADREEQYGILLERLADRLRVTIPPRFFGWLVPPVTIELDATELRIDGVINSFDDSSDHGRTHVRPRDKVYEIKAVRHSGNLFVKAHGFPFLECQPHRDFKVVEWIAARLNEAMTTLPAT